MHLMHLANIYLANSGCLDQTSIVLSVVCDYIIVTGH